MQANLIDFIRSSLNLTFSVAQLFTPALVWMGKGEPVAVQLSDPSSPLALASWGFVIGPAITLGGLIFAFDQVRFSRAADPVYRSIGWLTATALAAAIIWQITVIRCGLTPASLGVISLAILCATAANVRLGRQKLPLERRIRWRAAIYIGAFTGWMTVLAVANAVPVVEAGMMNLPSWQSLAGSALLFVVSVAAAIMQWQSRGSPWFAFAFSWALSAIACNGWMNDQVAATAALTGSLIVASTTLATLRHQRSAEHWFGSKVIWRPVRRTAQTREHKR